MSRNDIIGVLLLSLCLVMAGVLVYSIATGVRFRLSGPPWVGAVLGIIFIGAIIYSLVTSFQRRWPDPMTGRGRRWPWSKDDKTPPAAGR